MPHIPIRWPYRPTTDGRHPLRQLPVGHPFAEEGPLPGRRSTVHSTGKHVMPCFERGPGTIHTDARNAEESAALLVVVVLRVVPPRLTC